MQFITGNNRHQTYFSTLDDQVSNDNAARLMDAFIDKELFDWLVAKGKNKKLAVIAVANKLLKQVFGVVKNESLFDRNYYKKVV